LRSPGGHFGPELQNLLRLRAIIRRSSNHSWWTGLMMVEAPRWGATQCGDGVDLSLVLAAQSGDEEAFGSLARGWADRLFAVAHRILRDVGRAEDAVQQTLVTAWRELPGLREAERFDAWLYRILVNTCYAEARRARRWSTNVQMLPANDLASRDTTLDIVLRDTLDRGFRRLPPDQRVVFVFHHYLGLTLPEIADTLDIPLGTVKSRLHYATNALRAALEADARTSDPSSRERLA
jgi:RNA polymerase sigma-70 factor, ECF subfamily